MAKKEFNYEKFRDMAAAVQSLVIALGVLIGGIWTLYLFRVLNTREKAAAELKESKRLNHQGVVTIEVKAEQEFTPNDTTGRSIRINIQAKNMGDTNTTLELGHRPLAVAKLNPDNEGRLYKEWVKTSFIPYLDRNKLDSHEFKLNKFVEPVTTEVLRAGQTLSFPTWFHVEAPGLYFIEFAAELTGDDLKIIQEIRGEPNRQFRVTGQTFIVVK